MQVLLDPRWIDLPVGSPVEAGRWAAEAVAEALSLRGIVEEPRVVHLYVQTYAATLNSIRARSLEHDDVTVAGAYALVGQDELLADTVVDEPGQHEIVLRGERGSRLRFSTLTNATVAMETGCHLPAAITAGGRAD